MITTFDARKKILFFKTAWANEVTKWISQIKSPKGTIVVKNTLNPTDDGSLQIDVNLKVVAGKVREILVARAKAESASAENK